jgi:hypothetical protein
MLSLSPFVNRADYRDNRAQGGRQGKRPVEGLEDKERAT